MSVPTINQNSSLNLTPEKIDLIKRTVCKNATNDELELFLHACNRTGLDPFMKQIYAIKRSNVMTIQTGIDGYRLIADRTGKYMPGKESTYCYDTKGNLVSATSYVKKMDSKGEWHEISVNAHYKEYEGNTPIWKKMPHIMLAKCAESLALRKAFPAEMSGLYTAEEMHQADGNVPETVNAATGEVKTVEISEPMISLVEAEALDRDIALLIAPVDPEYRQRALKVFGKSSFDQLPAHNLRRIQANIAKKVEDLRSKELPDNDPDAVPF